MNEPEKIVDPRLWHVCAGVTIQVPLPNSTVCYFPQGHAEQTRDPINFDAIPKLRPYIHCKVIDIKLLADLEQEVYAKIVLRPLENNININNEENIVDTRFTPAASKFSFQFPYFAKKLSHSEVNGNAGLYLRQKDVETVFPRLICPADNAIQTLIAKDLHGEIWRFTHAYNKNRGRNLLTAGWCPFSSRRKLKLGDSVVFVKSESGDICIGIRRAMKAGISGMGKVRGEDVIDAVSRAENGEQFAVKYYPHASNAEFVVKASEVNAALCARWCDGMMFRMGFENEDFSGKTWFRGTVSSVNRVLDSPWRMLEVTWDEEQDLLQNMKYVNPWQVKVDLMYNNPSIQGARQIGCQTPIRIPILIQFPSPDQNQTDKLELDRFPKHYESHPPNNNPNYGNKDLPSGSSSHNVKKNNDKPGFRLFGQTIHADQKVNQSSEENANELDAVQKHDNNLSALCNVCFLGLEDVCLGTLDLSEIDSYEEVEKTLADMFRNLVFDSTSVVYKDSAGVVKQLGNEPFSEFVTKVKRLTIQKKTDDTSK